MIMATGNVFNGDYFFYWHISDVHLCPKTPIKSPIFSIQPFSGVFWCLQIETLDSVDFHGINCSLHRVPSEFGAAILIVDYQLFIDGPVVKRRQQELTKIKFFNMNQPVPKLYAEFSRDSLKLNKEMVIACKVLQCNFEQSINSGFYYPNLSYLAEDLLSGYLNQIFPDVTLNVQEHLFYTHRAILYARLPSLAARLFSMNYETQSQIEVYSIKPHLMKSLLHYAYSGCLTEECYNDSRELYNLAEDLQLTDLQQILKATSNVCVARTTMNVQKKSLSWTFDYPLNWTLGVEKDIALLPHSIGHAEILAIGYRILSIQNQEFLSVNFQFPKMLKGCTILLDCAVSATREVQNQSQTILDTKLRHSFTSNDVWSPEPLLSKPEVDQYVSTIKFVFKIKLCDGEYKSFIDDSNYEIALSLPLSRDFEKLSFDVSNLLEPALFYDIVLMTETRLQVPAHKAILSARSLALCSLIRQFTDPNNFLQIDGVSNEALIFIVYYIYSGKTKNLRLSNAQEFQATAEYFQIQPLVLEINYFLKQQHISTSDVVVQPY